MVSESLQCSSAGAILVGKTNMDQFATGLVGTRSPYGTPTNAFDDRFVPGGSSSGSAAVVGAGLVSFALGTDTAGSGDCTIGRKLHHPRCACMHAFVAVGPQCRMRAVHIVLQHTLALKKACPPAFKC